MQGPKSGSKRNDPMSRLLAYSGNQIATLSFYSCDCGMHFKALQESSVNQQRYRCECGDMVIFHGHVISLWKTRKLDSLFGTGWTEVAAWHPGLIAPPR